MAELNVNQADLLRFADAYSGLATQMARIAPQAIAEAQRVADTHGPIGYPTAIGIAAGLVNAQGPLQAKIADFGAYSQRFTEHAADYTTTDTNAASAQNAIKFADDKTPKDPNGSVQATDFDKNRAPLPQGPGDAVHKTPKWTDKNLFPTPPQAADVKQNKVGDCYFAATMGAVAHANPQWIKDRIHYDDQSGNFDVTLWNGHGWQHIPVTQNDLQTDRDHGGASWPDPKAPMWPSVLESAYAKMHSPSDELGYALDHGIGQGGQAHDAMQALTGNRGMTINPERVWYTRENIDQEITTALANHQPVTISSSEHGGPMVSNHTYIVERVDGTGDDAYLILRNPWEANPNDPTNSMSAVRLGDVIGSGLTGLLDGYGRHPTSEINIGNLGQ